MQRVSKKLRFHLLHACNAISAKCNKRIFTNLFKRLKVSSILNFLRQQNIEWSQLFTWAYFLFFLIVPISALFAKAFSIGSVTLPVGYQISTGLDSVYPEGFSSQSLESSFKQVLASNKEIDTFAVPREAHISVDSIGERKAKTLLFQNRFIDFFTIATQPIALSAYSVTFSMAAIASLFNAFFGFILAWVLVRYNFRFKRFLDAAIDLPFAVPTSVAGLTLATVYSPQGLIGSHLKKLGVEVVYTRLGVAIAMIFVSLPFVVRALQPVLQEIDEQIEEAAFSLGASPYTTFQKILFPPLAPAFLTGITLGFSRAIGEYGSLVLVSSNIPYKDLSSSVLIFQNLESYSLAEATVIATVVLLVSFCLLLTVSSLESWTRNRNT